jgi:hypothetical protein
LPVVETPSSFSLIDLLEYEKYSTPPTPAAGRWQLATSTNPFPD